MSHAGAAIAGNRPPYFTRGTLVVCAVALVGGIALLCRFAFGLGATTNLTDAYPWGIWIALDVATGVALAAGGFTTAFLVHIINRERFHPLLRPALLTAMIGYTFVAMGVATDLGRFWAIWHVLLPPMWQPNSVLFEVAICVMTYLTVLYIEFLPVVCARWRGRVRLPGRFARLDTPVEAGLRLLDATLGRVITVFVIMGIVLSCMHQSSLGTLMIIASIKLHPLWQTPLLPLLFLLSAFAVGFPMVIFESVLAARSLRLPAERDILGRLARIVPAIIGVYLLVRLSDLGFRGKLPLVLQGTRESALFIAEITLGFLTPMIIFMIPRLRRSVGWTFAAASLVIAGVVFNRLNVFLLCYTPIQPGAVYIPSWAEFAVTAGFVAMIVLLYRLVVLNFPVIESLGETHAAAVPAPRIRVTGPPVPRPAPAPRRRPRPLLPVRARTTREPLPEAESIP